MFMGEYAFLVLICCMGICIAVVKDEVRETRRDHIIKGPYKAPFRSLNFTSVFR